MELAAIRGNNDFLQQVATIKGEVMGVHPLPGLLAMQ